MATAERAAEMLTGRLVKNRRHLGRWAKRAGVGCWRVYDRDIPDVPVTIDDYQNLLPGAVAVTTTTTTAPPPPETATGSTIGG